MAIATTLEQYLNSKSIQYEMVGLSGLSSEADADRML